MSYEPLHHKYRPQTFAELVGQEAVAATLTNALRQQRIAPAYLFTGARGTGKTSSARILAKSLNCLTSDVPTAKPCGVCEVCNAIATGSALDVIEIDAASNTGVDNIRELIERAQFAPVQCRYKVYIIDEVHMLSTAAFNALLKTLEEPPNRVVFVLATTDPQRVLPTIISRCQRFDFRRIPLEAMVEHLGQIAGKEAIDITPDAVQLVAQISQGGLRDAEALLDQLSLLDGQITVERVWELVGAVPERDLLALVKAIAQDQATTVLDCARHLMDRGREPLIVLQNLASFYRDLLIAKTSPNRQDLVAITPPTWAEMCEFVHELHLGTILQGQQHLRESEVQVKNTTQPRLWLEVTLMGLLPSSLASAVRKPGLASQERELQEKTTQDKPPQGNRTVAQPQGVSSSPVVANGSRSIPRPAPAASQSTPSQSTPSQSTPSQSGSSQPTRSPLSQPQPPIVQSTPHPSTEVQPNTASEQPELPDNDLQAIKPIPVATEPELEPIEAENDVDLEQVWNDVIARLRFRGTQVLLQQQACLLSFSGDEARIGLRSKPLFDLAKKQLPSLETAFEAVYHRKVRVSLEVATATAATPAPSTTGTPDKTGEHSRSLSQPPSQAPVSEQLAPPPPQAYTRSAPSSSPPIPPSISPSIPPKVHESSPNYPRPEIPPPFSPISVAAETSPSSIPPIPWQEDDEVVGAARSLAQFFNGQIVSLGDDRIPKLETPDHSTDDFATTNLSDLSSVVQRESNLDDLDLDDDDSDVPF